MKITFHQLDISDLHESLGREWLETNGRGGYASGTIANCRSRKYHGLLVADLADPPGCYVLLAHLDDWVESGGRNFPLVTHQYGDTFSPDGHTRQLRFEQEFCPAFVYQCGELTVTRRIMMLQGEDTVLIRYDAEGPANGAVLRIRPLLAFRHIHQVIRANGKIRGQTDSLPNGFSIRPYDGMPTLAVQTNVKSGFTPQPLWYFNFKYAADAERGFEHTEDLFSPGIVEVKIRTGQPVILAVSTRPATRGIVRSWQQEENRRQAAVATSTGIQPRALDETQARLFAALRRAAGQFLITLPDGTSAVHAGYHWFGPWGRDTLLALPGLVFQAGELDLGVRILKGFVRHEKGGMLPNFINPDGTGAYTAVDPSLWLFWTVQQYLAAGGDPEIVRRDFWPTLLAIIRHFIKGTPEGVLVDQAGLLRAGTPSSAVTWMNAQVGGRPVIPRWGYMVEINALWYNAVCFAQELALDRFNDRLDELDVDFAPRLAEAFVGKFWVNDQQALLDTVNEYCSDASLRPNAIFAVSLPYSPLSKAQQRAIVGAIRRELFTPYGLRSLTQNDIRYYGVCQGENWVRELAYHQGSVWPWFLAHFAEALFRAEGRTRENRALFAPVAGAFEKHLREAGVGSISELFDGDPPHAPRGAIAQAWNVGEVLRLLHLLGA